MPNAILLLRLSYLTFALLVLLITSIPPLRSRFLDYGARTSQPKKNEKISDKTPGGLLPAVLDKAASICVPHNWFTSFYAISVLSTLYWASETLVKGPSFLAVAKHVSPGGHSMKFEQVAVTWLLMFAQGSRRLYECISFSTPSKSKMWVGHWALGILFYLGTGIAVWIEGTSMLQTHKPSVKDLTLTPPSPRTILGVLVFILASGVQHDCHAYLASLKKSASKPAAKTSKDKNESDYQLPTHPAFNISLTPHYFAECLIYTSLSIIAAPQGDWLNWTLVSALVFVAVNLGVTADGTRKWYREKFGEEAVGGRARMIPGVW